MPFPLLTTLSLFVFAHVSTSDFVLLPNGHQFWRTNLFFSPLLCCLCWHVLPSVPSYAELVFGDHLHACDMYLLLTSLYHHLSLTFLYLLLTADVLSDKKSAVNNK